MMGHEEGVGWSGGGLGLKVGRWEEGNTMQSEESVIALQWRRSRQ